MAYPTPDDLNVGLQVGQLRRELSLKDIGTRKIHARTLELYLKRGQPDRVVADTLVYLLSMPRQIDDATNRHTRGVARTVTITGWVADTEESLFYPAPCNCFSISFTAFIAALSFSGSRERTTRLVFGFWFSSRNG
jgi:hypothetical protein